MRQKEVNNLNSCQLLEALQQLKAGREILLVDDVGSTLQVFLLFQGATATSTNVCNAINISRGNIYAALSEERAKWLGLTAMPPRRGFAIDTPQKQLIQGQSNWQHLVSVEARHGVTTGISARDRAQTLRILAQTSDPRLDIISPGHIFPIAAKNGGTLIKSDIPEGAVDLMQLAELPPVGALSQCLDREGEAISTYEQLKNFPLNSFVQVSISEILRYRLANEELLEQIAETELPVAEGMRFRARCFRSKLDQTEHLALTYGELPHPKEPTLVRVQAEDRLADLGFRYAPYLSHENTFSVIPKQINNESIKKDEQTDDITKSESSNSLKHRREEVEESTTNTNERIIGKLTGQEKIRVALQKIHQNGHGVFVYIRHPKRNLLSLLPDLSLVKHSPPDELAVLREFGLGAQILRSLNISQITLISSSSRHLPGLEEFGIKIVGQTHLNFPNELRNPT